MKSVKTSKDTVIEFESSPERVRQIMNSVGSRIGNVTFKKKGKGEIRRMSYRVGVKNPKYSKKPSGNGNRKENDKANDIITVYSTNDVIRDDGGDIIGRGAYRRISLRNVIRVVAGGKVYEIQRNGLVV